MCIYIYIYMYAYMCVCVYIYIQPHAIAQTQPHGEMGGWGRDPFSRNFMKPTPRRKWYLTTGRRAH